MLTVRGIVTLVVLIVLFTLAVIWISKKRRLEGRRLRRQLRLLPPALRKAQGSKRQLTPLPLPCTERGLCCARSQQAVPGGVDRQGAQQVGVGLW